MLNKQDNKPAFKNRLSEGLKSIRLRMGVLAWGAVVVFVIQRGTDVGNLVSKLFLGRVLLSEDFGAVEPVLITISMLALPASIIFATAVKSISRLKSQGLHAQCRALIHDLQCVAVVGSILSMVVVICLKNFIMTRLHIDSPMLIWMIAILFLLSWWAPLILALIRAEHRYRLLCFNNIAGPCLVVVSTIVLVGVMKLGLEGAIAARTLSGGVIVVVLMFVIRAANRGDREPYTEERAAMFRMIVPMSILIGVEALAVNFDRLFVRNFMIADSGGISAVYMLGQIPRMIIMPIIFVIFPIAAAAHASGRKLGSMLHRSVMAGVAITAICCLGLSVVATPLLRLWQPEFAPYGRLVWIYALMAGLQALNGIVAQIEMARHQYGFLWFYAIPVVLACVGLYIFQDHLKISLTLSAVLWALVIAQVASLVSVGTYIFCRRNA